MALNSKSKGTSGGAKPKGPKKKAAKGGMSGVSFDEGGPVLEEAMSPEQRELRAEQLVNLMAQIDQLDAERAAQNATWADQRREMAAEVRSLAESLRTGKIKIPAQQGLPGVGEQPAEANA